MFEFDMDCDLIGPSGRELLSELGMDVRTVRDALADDLSRRCPDREARREGSWSAAGEG